MNLKMMWNIAPLFLASANINAINIKDKEQNQMQKYFSWFKFLNLEGDLSKKSRGIYKDKQAWERMGEEDDYYSHKNNQELKEKSIKLISEYLIDPQNFGQNLSDGINSKLQQISTNILIKSKWNNLYGKVQTSDFYFHFYINNSWYFDFNVYLSFLGNKWHFYFWGKETDRHIDINFI